MKVCTSDKWNTYLKYFEEKDKDIYFTEEYVKLYENERDSAECFVCQEGDNTFLFPFLKRKIDLLNNEYCDFETAYGYGGPLTNTGDEGFNLSAWNSFNEFLKENKYVAGFIRFHPLLQNHKFSDVNAEVAFDRNTIAMDLKLSEEDIWTDHVHRKHRGSIRKAEKNGLSFVVDTDLKHYDEFIVLYKKMMDNLQSDKFYYFNEDYYKKIFSTLGKDSFLGLVMLDGKIIAAIIFFLYGIYGHAHLGGGLDEYFDYCPNNFMFYKAGLYLKERGAEYFHFGGGITNAEDDALFKFKKRFSKDRYDFYLGKMLINKEKYDEACSLWVESRDGDKDKSGEYFLKYRY